VRARRRPGRAHAGRVWRWRSACRPETVGALRHQLEDVATGWELDEDETFRLLMVVNELVTNVVQHACTRYRVTVRLLGSALRVLVTDYSTTGLKPRSAEPRSDQPREDPDGGLHNGLRIVDALTAQWGWARNRAGKTVWASISHAQA
jgi:anti-sigma regulatory factor (Ser/Thr protein kinase)